MAEELNRWRSPDLNHLHMEGVGSRRSLPVTVKRSTPDIVLKSRPSLNLSQKNREAPQVGKFFPDPMSGGKMAFGSPSYPSPLDRIRSGQQERLASFGMGPAGEASFEANQSFPKTSKTKLNIVVPSRKLNLNKFKGTDLNDVSFTGRCSKGSFNKSGDRSSDQLPSFDRSMHNSRELSLNSSRELIHLSKENSMSMSIGENSMTDSWSFYNFIGGAETGMTFPTTVRNPNKALCTINGKTSEILVANEMACELFGYEEAELIGMNLKNLVKLKPKEQATIMESHLEPSGQLVSLAGKVVDAVDKHGLILPVSMWVKKLDCDKDPRCLIVMEPVERSVATVKFTADGRIVSCDDQMAYIHGYPGPETLQGADIKDLIPAIKLPSSGEKLSKDVRKQRATGRTKDGINFPLSIALDMVGEEEEVYDNVEVADMYKGIIWVFANISGLITFLPDGTIHSMNENFSLMLFGYKASEVVGKNISLLIPDFYEILDLVDDSMPLPPVEGDSDNNCSGRMSTHSKDSGRNSSRSSSKGTNHGDSDDQGIGTSVTSSVATFQKLDIEGFNLNGPGVTSTPNKPTVSETLTKRLSHDDLHFEAEAPVIGSAEKPPRAELQLDLLNNEDNRVVSPDKSTDHSATSTSSTDTLITAKEVNPTSVSVTYCNINTDGKEGCNNSQQVDLNSNHKNEVLVCTIDTRTGTYGPKQIEMGEKDSEGADIDVEVCKSNENDAKNNAIESKDEASTGIESARKEIKDGIETGEMSPCKVQDTVCKDNINSHGSSTPLSKDVQRLKQQNMTVSPCLSDIVSLDSGKNSPTMDSSAIEGGDELEDSVSDGDSRLNTTDELIAASMGLVRLNTVGRKDNSVVEDDVEEMESVGCDEVDGNVVNSSSRTSDKGCKLLNNLNNSRCVEELSSDSHTSANGSSIDVIEDVDVSALHKTSISQFLNSRCSRSRNFDDSGSSVNRFNQSKPLEDSRSGVEFSNGVEVYYPNGILSPELLRNGFHEDSNSEIKGCDITDNLSASLRSFEHHEKGVRYLTKSRNGSKSSDYSSNGTLMFPEGSYQGQCQHRDKSLLGILFQIKRVQLEDGNSVYCMWVSRDPEEPAECGRSFANLTLASSLNSTMDQSNFSLGEALLERANSASKEVLNEVEDPAPVEVVPHIETEEDRAINYGPYNRFYDTLHTIGKGAFGFVKLGLRKRDQTQVVVKFIRRAKVFSDCWVQDETHGRIPQEVSILTKLDHPNIVTVLDVFQNAEFIQMVMEKHGSGMDLFEFIDRSPRMDEGLASYIFRQMVSAVSYLHSKNILHRDIKDENVILNEQFQIKLIDFGAVAFLEPCKLFGTFCGTLEYCSPEVLMGNKYRGPELEVWSLGVTLYTLVFGENPFFDVDETIKCVLKPPFPVSSELMMLICWLLHPEPKHRATVPSLEKNCWVQQTISISNYKWHEVLPNSEFHGNTASDNRPDTPPAVDNTAAMTDIQGDIENLKCNLISQLNLSDSESSSCSSSS